MLRKIVRFIIRVREFIVLIIVSTFTIISEECHLELYQCLSFVLFVGVVLLLLRTIRKNVDQNDTKRFTHLDNNGNPCIKVEDLPEIVDYLYFIEEERERDVRK